MRLCKGGRGLRPVLDCPPSKGLLRPVSVPGTLSPGGNSLGTQGSECNERFHETDIPLLMHNLCGTNLSPGSGKSRTPVWGGGLPEVGEPAEGGLQSGLGTPGFVTQLQ